MVLESIRLAEQKAVEIVDINKVLAEKGGTPGVDKEGNKGVWITAKGGPLFIKKGEDAKSAMDRREAGRGKAGGFFERRKEKKERKSAFKKASREKKSADYLAKIKSPEGIKKNIHDLLTVERGDSGFRSGVAADLGNAYGSKEAKTALQTALKDKESVVRYHAKFALKRIERKDGSLSPKDQAEFEKTYRQQG